MISAAIGFPIIILLLIPLRTLIIPLLPFTEEELAILDRPTASAFVSFTFIMCYGFAKTCIDDGICRRDPVTKSRFLKSLTTSNDAHVLLMKK